MNVRFDHGILDIGWLSNYKVIDIVERIFNSTHLKSDLCESSQDMRVVSDLENFQGSS